MKLERDYIGKKRRKESAEYVRGKRRRENTYGKGVRDEGSGRKRDGKEVVGRILGKEEEGENG